MKRFFRIFAMGLLAALLGTVSAQAKPAYTVIGYLPDYQSAGPLGDALNLSKLPWADLTHVFEFAARFDASSNVTFPNGQRAGLVAAAHSQSTRCYLSFGGQGDSAANWRTAIGTNRATAVSNIMQAVTVNGYDGIDIDWEFPQGPPESPPNDLPNFMAFMTQLHSALVATNGYDGNPRGLTFFISPGYQVCGVDWTTIGSVCEYGILSGYAYGFDQFNGPLSDATQTYSNCLGNMTTADIQGSVSILSHLGFPQTQLIVGCPLYSQNNGNRAVLSTITSATQVNYFTPQDEASFNNGDTGVNTFQSFCDKMNWAFGQSPALPGIALFEITMAYPPTNSAVTALWTAIGSHSTCSSIPTWTPVPTPTPVVSATWRVNAGGPAYSDSLGHSWAADENFTGGTPATIASGAVTGTADPILYNTERYGVFTYTFVVPPGSYQVTLKFAEIYYTTAGQRVFNVAINGTPVLSNFDIVADSGAARKADDKVFDNINPGGGAITLQFTTGSADQPKVSAIQIVPEPPTPTPTFTPTPTDTPCMVFGTPCTPTLTPTPTPTPDVGNPVLYPNPVKTGNSVILHSLNQGTVSDVRVQVFTLAFRQVQDLTFPQNAPGKEITLGLYDKVGAPLANGLYYLVVTTDRGHWTGKLLVLK